MKLIDMLSSTWAIIPDHLNNIAAIISAHIRGPKLDLGEIEAKLMALSAPQSSISDTAGVRVIPIIGIISKRPSAFERIFFDGVSSEQIKAEIIQARTDPAVNKIILYIDSPGGTVDGMKELGDVVYETRGIKQIIAFSDGTIASAAYSIGSAADKVYLSSGTVRAGSIGVVGIHTDYSEQSKMNGITVTEIVAGKYKRIASSEKPLSEEGAAWLQSMVDYQYAIMVEDIARNRGASVDDVLKNMADGQIFIGQQAVEAGLVDGISSSPFEIKITSSAPGVGALAGENNNMEVNRMTIQELKEKFADIYKAVFDEGSASKAQEIGDVEVAKKDAFNAGAKYERERIQAVKGTTLKGHEALIETLMFDGKTTGNEAAGIILKAEQAEAAKRLTAFQQDLNPLASAGDPPAPKKEPDKNKPVEERAKAEWDGSADLRAEFQENYESFLAYMKASERGSARIRGQEVK